MSWLCAVSILGLNLAFRSSSYWLGVFDALLCCLTTISAWTITRLYRRVGMQMAGRAFTMLTEPFGLLVMIAPAKEGRNWKIIQWRVGKWWDIVGRLMEPVGRGASPARAMTNLWASIDPRFATIPSEALEELVVELDAEFEADVARQMEHLAETRVE